MIPVLMAATGLLALLTLFNAVLCFGVIRRLRFMETDDCRGLPDADLPPAGTLMSPFATTDTSGTAITDRDLRTGRAFVGLLKIGCPACERFVSELDRGTHAIPENGVIIIAPDGDGHAGSYAVRLAHRARVILAGPDDPVLTAFGELKVLPTFLRLQSGVVAHSDTSPAKILRAWSSAHAHS